MAQPPKRTSESTRHLRAVGQGLRDLTPEETDLRTRQILMWGHAADCMNALVDESVKQRDSAAEGQATIREAAASVRSTILVAVTVSLLLHLVIAVASARGLLAPGSEQAKREPVLQP